MLRARNVVDSARGAAGSKERVWVAQGELKVACGEDLVLETEPLSHGFALAVFDPESHIGGIVTSAGPGAGEGDSNPAGGVFLDAARALSALVDSVVRTGADRRRLSFVATGDVSTLASALGAGAQAPAGQPPRVRLRKLSRPMILILDLKSCQARAMDASELAG